MRELLLELNNVLPIVPAASFIEDVSRRLKAPIVGVRGGKLKKKD